LLKNRRMIFERSIIYLFFLLKKLIDQNKSYH